MKNLYFVLILAVSQSQAWAATPALTRAPTVSPTPAQAVLVPTYDSIRLNVFVQKCLLCHAPTGHAKDFPLDTYATMMAQGELVVAGSLTQSTIVDVMAQGKMPPVRSGIPAVTADELAVIRAWIVNGAPEH
jgi:mono/diheme cytochrome c family protein